MPDGLVGPAKLSTLRDRDGDREKEGGRKACTVNVM
jgi:hypothetical protein